MKRWQMYSNIQSMKNQGFSKRQVADKQGLNFRTVSKYWDMTPEEIEESLNRERRRDLSLYEGVVTDWLKNLDHDNFPDEVAGRGLWQHFKCQRRDP